MANHKSDMTPVGWLVAPYGEWKPNFNLRTTFPPEALDWSIPLYFQAPILTRQPLTLEMYRRMTAQQYTSLEMQRAFTQGWLQAEKSHGIEEE